MKDDYQWLFDGINSLELKKKSLDFNQYFRSDDIIIWRGITIEVNIRSHRTGMPVTTEYGFIINYKKYKYTVSRSYGGGMSSGKLPKPILAEDHSLTFLCNGLDCMLKEEKLNTLLNQEVPKTNPFKILEHKNTVTEKTEPYFKNRKNNYIEQKYSIYEDKPTIEINEENLVFDNGKLISGAEDICIERKGLKLLFEVFEIDIIDKEKFLDKVKELYLNNYKQFEKFLESKNIPYHKRRL
jgi:hypothetical protein